MTSRFGLVRSAALLGILAAGCRAAPPDARETWLKDSAEERFHQIESHLRGLDVAMMDVGYRFTELYWAGRDLNWAYAKYQAEKIGLAIRLAVERRPKRADSARPFLAEEVPAILAAIDGKSEAGFHAGMERLRAACMRCHVLEKLPDFTLEFPERRISPVRKVR